jgi:glucose-1-phosphate thymidylyltransferase
VIAGDNLFEFSLADYVAWWRRKGTASAVALHDVRDRELAKQYGVVEVASDDRIRSLVEKPDNPRSTLCATATYLYHREHVPLVERYLEGGNSPDQPGRFLVWLHEREPVYGYRFEGEWLDIGDHKQLLEADNRLRRRRGLPERAEYVLD